MWRQRQHWKVGIIIALLCVRWTWPSEGNQVSRPDLSEASSEERSMMEKACAGKRLLYGPAAYYECLHSQLAALRNSRGRPDLSKASEAERAMMEKACAGKRLLYGPAAYYDCLRSQLAELSSSEGKPDLTEASPAEQAMMEKVCAGKRLLYGPAAYYDCLRSQLAELGSSEGKPDLTGASPAEQAMMEKVCAGKRLLYGPAAYYKCLRSQVDALLGTSRGLSARQRLGSQVIEPGAPPSSGSSDRGQLRALPNLGKPKASPALIDRQSHAPLAESSEDPKRAATRVVLDDPLSNKPIPPDPVPATSGDSTWLWLLGGILALGGPALFKAARDRMRSAPCSECSRPTPNANRLCNACLKGRLDKEEAARREAAWRESEERVREAAQARRVREEERRSRLRSLDDLQRLDGVEFEKLVASLFVRDGYAVRQCGGRGDEGIDLVIDVGGSSDVAQCKRWRSDVGAATVREFYGSLMHAGARHGFIITTAGFSDAAREFARGKPITLMDGGRLVQWLEGCYAPGPDSQARKAPDKAFDPYKVLDVPENATEEMIRISYKRLIAVYHPDKVAHLGPELQKVALLKAQELNRAYELLTNQSSRGRAV